MKRKRIINALAAILIACSLAAGITTTITALAAGVTTSTALGPGDEHPEESITF